MGNATPQRDALSAILGSRLFQVSAILLSILALPIEVITVYRTGQEILINENMIREGSATAQSAEEVAQINANKVGQSSSEAAKMKADADSAGSLVEINRNKVGQSLSEAKKMEADAGAAESEAKINKIKIGTTKANLVKAQQKLITARDVLSRQ